jgi:hypothetical protein
VTHDLISGIEQTLELPLDLQSWFFQEPIGHLFRKETHFQDSLSLTAQASDSRATHFMETAECLERPPFQVFTSLLKSLFVATYIGHLFYRFLH